MKSIRARIRLRMSMTLIISLAVMAVTTMVLNYRSTVETLERTMTETTRIAAERVEMELETYKQIAYEVGCLPNLSDPDISVEEKQEIVGKRAAAHNLQRGNILGTDGVSIFDGKDYTDREYFKRALKGECYVSTPLVSKITGKLSIMVAAPIWKDGVPDSDIVGVIYFVPEETFLNNIVSGLNLSAGGSAYMLDKEGNTIAHMDMDKVKNQENTQKDVQEDSGLKDLAKLEFAMTQGENGFGKYSYGGATKFLAYAPVSGTDGWSLGVNVPQSDMMGATYVGIALTIVLLLVAAGVTTPIAGSLAKSISEPINACVERMQSLVNGDLASPVPESKLHDEIGVLLDAIRNLVGGLNELIGDMDYLLSNMANGNFDVYSRCKERYAGEFSGLLKSVDHLSRGLSGTMREIDQASDQVSLGSGQMSESSQALAEGAMEQATSIQELAENISQISGQVDATAQHAKTATEENKQSNDKIQVCRDHMDELVKAMQMIDKKSKEISKVIKTLEDIVYQTNLLALNASVEAARAGEMGRGFAVVAEEVQKLASESSDAAQATSVLVKETLKTVQDGTRISGETDKALGEVVASAERVLDAVTLIFKATDEQSEAVAQVSKGIEQISDVIQNNSAAAQQSAAASQELSGQADRLKEQVNRFTLRK